MAFPTTSVLEPFTGSGALSASWVSPAFTGDSTPVRYNDVCVGPMSVYSSAIYDASTFGPDSESYLTVPAAATASESIVLWVKIKNPNTGTACYYTGVFDFAGDMITLVRGYNNAENTIATQAFTLTGGTLYQLGLCAKTVGSDIVVEAWVKTGAGAWTLAKTFTDTGAVATYPLLASSGGKIGFAVYTLGSTDVTRCVDDFGGGTVTVVTLDSCLPDADVVTTGWSTAPLYSKVNDSSDATVIQATAV